MKLISKYYILFELIVNGIIFLIAFFGLSTALV